VWVISVMHHSKRNGRPTHSGHLFAHQASDTYSTGALMGGGILLQQVVGIMNRVHTSQCTER